MQRLTLNRPIWRTVILGGLALCAGSTGMFLGNLGQAEEKPAVDARLTQRGAGKGEGGNREGGNRGGGHPGGESGGNRAGGTSGNRGPVAPHSGGGGSVRRPSGEGARQPAPGGQRPIAAPPAVNRVPTMSQPRVPRQPGAGNSPAVKIRPSVNSPGRSPSGPPTNGTVRGGTPPVGDRNTSGLPGTRDLPNSGRVDVRGDSEVRSGGSRGTFDRSPIGDRQYRGNTVNFNNRTLRIGHGNYQPSYYRHSNYHGSWNGNRFGSGFGTGLGYRHGGYGGYGWGGGYGGNGSGFGGYRYRPIGWGLGGWGLGSLYYNSGYLGYSNPYYVSSGPVYYNYAQPIAVSYIDPAPVVQSPPDAADSEFNNAVAAFRLNDYDAALDITNKAIVQSPDDAVLHEFRSLVLFAKQDYQQSAATIHSVLAVGPGWDWTTQIGMYGSASTYTDQLRALETFTKANPQDAGSRFLLSYHYMTCGHPDDAARTLREVVRLMPNDRVAADVLKMVAAPDPAQSGQAPLAAVDTVERPAPMPVEVATLVGTWNAARPDGSRFDLNLTPDAKFTWSFAQKDEAAQKFDGTYTMEGNVLALERTGGGSLVAEITPAESGKFNFKMVGAPEDDQGLTFQK